MATKPLKRPRDPIQLAKLIGDIATGQVVEEKKTVEEVAATEYARRGGRLGGKARSIKLTPEQRSEIARTAAAARWKKS